MKTEAKTKCRLLVKSVRWWGVIIVYLYPFLCLGANGLFGWNTGELFTFGLDLKDFMTTWVALGGVIAVVIGIFQTQKRITKQGEQFEEQIKKQNEQIDLQRKQQRDARFASGDELLGNLHESTRIGGAYSLYYLARDNKEYRTNVCEILCTHLRCIANKMKFQGEEIPENRTLKETFKYQQNEEAVIISLLFNKTGEKDSIFIN